MPSPLPDADAVLPRDHWKAALVEAGLRVTRPRLAVLAAVETHPHSPADIILSTARRSLGEVSTQAVYDVLHALTEARLLRRIEPAGSPMLYETRVDDNHHHMVCRSCGAVVDVPCETDAIPCATPGDERGFAIDEAEITFWGRCSACRAPQSHYDQAPTMTTPSHPHRATKASHR